MNEAVQQESVREALANAITTLLTVRDDLHSGQWRERNAVDAVVERLRAALHRVDAARRRSCMLPEEVALLLWGKGV